MRHADDVHDAGDAGIVFRPCTKFGVRRSSRSGAFSISALIGLVILRTDNGHHCIMPPSYGGGDVIITFMWPYYSCEPH